MHGEDGWEVIVMASKPFKYEYDFRLNQCVPKDVKIHYDFVGIFRPLIKLLALGIPKKKPQIEKRPKKTRSKKSISLTPFDQYVWDVNSAIHNGKKLVKKYKPDVIWVNADPWSGFLVADKLSRKFNIPWVADLRDPWTVFEKKMQWRPWLTVKIIKSYEQRFFKSASKVILNTETALDAYKETYHNEPGSKFSFIRNAFNECLLRDIGIKLETEPFTFGYYGGFRELVPSGEILKGFSQLVKKHNLSPSEVRFEVRGTVYPEFWDQVSQYELADYVNVEGEINLGHTVRLLRSWDVLLISAIHDRRWMIPAKFYDYIFARKPILAISDNTELNSLIEKSQSGSWVATKNPDEIFKQFETYFLKGKSGLLKNESLIEPYGLKSQAGQFLQTLTEVSK